MVTQSEGYCESIFSRNTRQLFKLQGMVKLRPLVPSYRPSRVSVHETTRAIVMAMDVLGTQLRKAA